MRALFKALGALIFVLLCAGCDSSVSVQDTAEAFVATFPSTLMNFREDQGPIDVPVRLSQVASETMSITWGVKTTDSSGRCTTSGGTVTFAPGEQTKNIRVCEPTNNGTYQGTTTLVLEILGISLGSVGSPDEMTVRLSDDEPAPFFSFQSDTSTRSESFVTTFTLTVELANAQAQAVTVPLQLGGTAQLGSDYVISPNPPSLVFAAGEISKDVSITILNEASNNFADEEPDETIVLTIPQTQDVEPGTIPTHTITITDDDYPLVSLANVAGAEGTAAPFTASLNRLSTRDVTFNYTSLDGTAADGVDYSGVSGSATIPAGSAGVSVDVPIRRTDDPGIVGRTVDLQISAFSNASNTSSISATATIDRSDLFVPFVTKAFTSLTTPIATLAPVRPLAGVAPTFSRGAPALVREYDGRVSWAKVNEARFPGLRRIENLSSFSQDFSNAAWTKGTGVTVTGGQAGDPQGQNAATLLEYDGSGVAGDPLLSRQQTGAENLNTYVFSLYAKATTDTDLALFIDNSSVTISIPDDDTWRRYSISATLSAAGDIDYGLAEAAANAAIVAGAGVEIFGAQFENVTGRVASGSPADPLRPPSEYVSTNVASAPVYTGAGVDGVLYAAFESASTVDALTQVVSEVSGSEFSDPEGLLVEGASTNLLTRSAQLESAPWVQGGGVVVVANAGLAPDGSLQAESLEDTGGGFATHCQNITVPNDDTAYTLSVFVQKNDTAVSSFGMNMSFLGGTTLTSADVRLDLSTGEIGGSGSAKAEDYGSWYRLTLTHANNELGNMQASICLFPAFAANGQAQVQPSAAGTVLVWGLQLEALPFATSYIATAAAAAARATETLSYDPPAGFAVNAPYAVTARAKALGALVSDNCATANLCQLAVGSNSSHSPYLRVSAGSGTSSASFGSTNALTNLSSLATTLLEKTSALFYVGSQTGSTFRLHVGANPGTSLGLGTAPAAPSQLYVGGNSSGNALYGTLRYFEVWKRALQDGEARNLKGY